MAQSEATGYCATKFAVRGFTESLRQEMILGRHPVRVTVVHPGGVRTNIAAAALEDAERRGVEVDDEERERNRVYTEKLLKMPAAQAATIIADGVEANRSRVLVGNDAKFADLLVRLIPAHYPRVVAWWARRIFGYKSPQLTAPWDIHSSDTERKK